eukprot:m51a1_g7507 hypothetical protein (269) ;mRNA; f:286791-287933
MGAWPAAPWRVGCVVQLDRWRARPPGLCEAAPEATLWLVVGTSPPPQARRGTEAVVQWLLPPHTDLNPSRLACPVNLFKVARVSRAAGLWSPAGVAFPGQLGEPVSNEFGAPREVSLQLPHEPEDTEDGEYIQPSALVNPDRPTRYLPRRSCTLRPTPTEPPQSPTPPPPPKKRHMHTPCEDASPRGEPPVSESDDRPREKVFPEEGALVSDLVDQWYKGIVPGASREELADVRALGDVLLRNPALAEHQAEVFDFFQSIKPALGALS